jgi:uncharacterized OB-fold protein
MFSLCETCGYTAEPQDIWCANCYRNEKKFIQMIRKVNN